MDLFSVIDEVVGRVSPFDERSAISLDAGADALDKALDFFDRLLGE